MSEWASEWINEWIYLGLLLYCLQSANTQVCLIIVSSYRSKKQYRRPEIRDCQSQLPLQSARGSANETIYSTPLQNLTKIDLIMAFHEDKNTCGVRQFGHAVWRSGRELFQLLSAHLVRTQIVRACDRQRVGFWPEFDCFSRSQYTITWSSSEPPVLLSGPSEIM